jgi:hypothetical protein
MRLSNSRYNYELFAAAFQNFLLVLNESAAFVLISSTENRFDLKAECREEFRFFQLLINL